MTRRSSIAVTGANGFVGRTLVENLMSRSWDVTAVVRDPASYSPAAESGLAHVVSVGDIDKTTDWSAAIKGCDVVIHLAARAHLLNDTAADPLSEFRAVNVDGTLNLARQAANAGVRRFIFVSSIGVLGNQNKRPFCETDAPNPIEPYAVSKLEAENGLREISAETGMEFVIVRPPLVYGPNCRGNFNRLLKLVYSGVPLPFGAVDSRRSFVSVWNLSDFLVACLETPAAANRIFLVSDGVDVSLTGLLRSLACGMGKKIRLVPVPLKAIYAASALIGKKDLAKKLCGSLTVDIGFTTETLKWTVPLTVAEGLDRTARLYRKDRQSR